MVDELFVSLGLDKPEWVEDIASFLACIEESISEREGRQFEERLNSKVKLDMYKRFEKEVEFKRYLRGVGDAGTRLLFKFRSQEHMA